MNYRHHESKSNSLLKFLLLFIIALTIGAFVSWLILTKQSSQTINTKSNPINSSSPTVQSVNGRYLFNGTIFWGRAIEKWSQNSDGLYDYTHPFSQLKTFDRDKYDAWVADLECPVLDIDIPYQVQVDQLKFNCRPEFLSEAVKYFNIIDLANNHSGDQGLDGYSKTKQAVIKAGAQTFGHYDPSLTDDTCAVIALPVRLKPSDKKQKASSLPVAFCAWHYFYRTPAPGEIEVMKKYAKSMPVFAFVHMGQEYLTNATPIQQDIARQVIDAGADFVIANNPHWVQNSEVYKKKLIFYSTGNFIFDQIDAEGMRSASVDLKMSVDYDDNLQKWLDMGEKCKKHVNNCFDLGASLSKPRYQLKFELVAGDNSTHVTKKGDKSLQSAIEKRANWTQTLSELGQ